MPSDDILDLLGRYASGSLSADEQKRLFDAALHDQDLFDQLGGEQELKQLLDEPGVRDRVIRALEPPTKRKAAWIFGIAATAAASIALLVVLLRPAPKPQQIAVAKLSEPAPIARTESAPQPIAAPAPAAPRPPKTKAAAGKPEAQRDHLIADQPSVDQPSKDAAKNEAIQVQAAAAAPVPQLQNAVGGPRQPAPQARAAFDAKTSAFGFHYSVETKGHLIIVPGADGYLFVRSSDGAILFSRKQIAAAITTDIALPDGVNSVSVTFSRNSSPVQTAPIVRTDSSGSVEGATGLAIEIKIR
jgi:hypothetical protein